MKAGIQYTIRNIPENVDTAIRRLAVREGASLNAAVLEVLKAGTGAGGEPAVYHDLDDLAGTWVRDEAFDKAQEAFEAIDPRLWS